MFDSGSINIAVSHGVLSKLALVLTVSEIGENYSTSGPPQTADICWWGPIFHTSTRLTFLQLLISLSNNIHGGCTSIL